MSDNPYKRFTESEINDFGEAFKLLDQDENGTISAFELYSAMKAFGYTSCTHDDVKKIINTYDKNHDGSIDFEEFLQIMLLSTNSERETGIWRAFRMIDTNSDGFISTEEIVRALKKLGMSIKESCVNEMLEECDKNGDGLIDYKEFLDLFLSR